MGLRMGAAGEGAGSTGHPADAKGARWKPGKEEGSAGVEAAAAGCAVAGVSSPAMEAGDPKAGPGRGVPAAGDGTTDDAGLWATRPAACRGAEVNPAEPPAEKMHRNHGLLALLAFAHGSQHSSASPHAPGPKAKNLRPPDLIRRLQHFNQALPASAFLAEAAGEARTALGDGPTFLEGVNFALGVRPAPTA